MDQRRGAHWFLVFWWVLCIGISISNGESVGICETKGCKCIDKSGGWKVANCTFEKNQDVTFGTDSIHQKVIEIFILGGNSLVFQEKSINSLPGLDMLYIGNTKEILMQKHAVFNSTSYSLRFNVENCNRLFIESEAFAISDSTLIIEVNKAKTCKVLGAAFCKLINATFLHIEQLELVEKTFEITKKEINRHGPATTITFIDVKISKIPTQAFYSPLAEIKIIDSTIEEIHSRAFAAAQITSIYLSNVVIGDIKSEACSQNTLITEMRFSRCKISKLETKAVICAISNLTMQSCSIRDIDQGAINTTSAIVGLYDNEIINFQASSLGFNSWNKIVLQQNRIKNLGVNSIYGEPQAQLTTEFIFKDNDFFNLEENSLSLMSTLPEESIVFTDNYFHIKCHCFLDEWLGNVTKSNRKIDDIMNNSFCTVDDLLARCYELKNGSINMMNFTELVCAPGNTIQCEHYNGEERVVNITNPEFLEPQKMQQHWLILNLTILGVIIIAVVATLVFLIINGGRWLKRKAYLRNIHYSPNETSNDEENTIVTMDQDSEEHKQDLPEELTLEYLEYLKKRLDDPATHQETSDMIERLYEMFIIEDNYDNNNRHDEEAHLYEELANNLQNQPAVNVERKSIENMDNGPLSILKMMEERFNLQYIDTEDASRDKPSPLVNEYSEPSDAAVHLYSELKQNQMQNEHNEKKDSVKSGSSGSMVARPLPHKPNDFYGRAGPSSLD